MAETFSSGRIELTGIFRARAATPGRSRYLGRKPITVARGIPRGKRGIVAAVCVLVATSVHAGSGDEVNGCLEMHDSRDPRVQQYTQTINAVDSSNIARATAFYLRGTVSESMGNLSCAAKDYDSAIELNPRLAPAHVGRGAIWLNSGNPDRALVDLDAAVGIDPRLAPAHLVRGAIWRAKGDLGKAIADFDRAIEIDSRYVAAYYARAHAWRDKHDVDREIADYDSVIRLNPKVADVFVDRGNAYDNKGESAKAIADYDAAIRIDPARARAYKDRGTVFAAEGDYEHALADFAAALKRRPWYAEAIKARGRTHFLQGRFSLAAEDLAEALQLEADPYAALWLFLATERSGADGARKLADNMVSVDAGPWPAAVLRLFVGKTPPQAAAAQARNRDPQVRRDRQCELDFYLGEWLLLKGRYESAAIRLARAQSKCPHAFVERVAAKVELKRLAGSASIKATDPLFNSDRD